MSYTDRDLTGEIANLVESLYSREMRFPGFEHLQMAYLIGDDDAPCVVPLDQATAHELDLIADRLEKEGKAKLKHAQEVRKYRLARFGDARAAA